MSAVILHFPDDATQAQAVGQRLGIPVYPIQWRKFPDEESLITIEGALDRADVVLLATLRNPDVIALPLYFAARTARELGAARVGLVAPYLGYMRQDARFHAGEAASARLFAQFLGNCVDWLVTVDPHLHRIRQLEEVFAIPATVIQSGRLIAEWIRQHVHKPMLFGPDSESAQWVAAIAEAIDAPHEVLEKHREGDRSVTISAPSAARLQDFTPVLVDDIVSSGTTMAEAIGQLRRMHDGPIACVVIHAVFAGDALQIIEKAGASTIVSTDSIPHPSNAIGLAAPLASAIAARLGDRTMPVA